MKYFTTVISVNAKTAKQVTGNNASPSVMKVSVFPLFIYVAKILMTRVICYFGEKSSDKSFMYKIELCI